MPIQGACTDTDDEQIGHILTRREVLTLLGATGAALPAGCGPRTTTTTASTSAAAASTNASTAASLNPETQTAEAIASDPAASAAQQAEVATAEAANTAAATPDCMVRPEVTEGPYYVAEDLVRSDIREDRTGTPLALTFSVLQVGDTGCTSLAGATPDTLNSTDNIYQDLLLLTTSPASNGYAATFPIGIDLSTVGTGQNSGGPGGPPPRPSSSS